MGASVDLELLAQTVFNPGRLVLGPTTIAGGFPYGGLNLGFTRFMELRISTEYQRTPDPVSGETAEVGRRSVENPALGCVLEGVRWDEDMIQAIFLKTIRGTSQPIETQMIGSSLPRNVAVLPPVLFVPDAAVGKSVYFLRPVVLLNLRSGIQFAQDRQAGMPIIFMPTRALNRDPWQVSRLEMITL